VGSNELALRQMPRMRAARSMAAPEFLPIEIMRRVTSGQAMTSNVPTMSVGMKSAALRRMTQRYASCCGTLMSAEVLPVP